MQTYPRRRVERGSHPILSKIVHDARHQTVALRRLRLERRPAANTLGGPGDRQCRGGRVKRNDATNRDTTVGQYE